MAMPSAVTQGCNGRVGSHFTFLRRAFNPPLLDGVWRSRADRPRQHESATTPTLSLSALPWPAPHPQFVMRALYDWERCCSSSTAVLPAAA